MADLTPEHIELSVAGQMQIDPQVLRWLLANMSTIKQLFEQINSRLDEIESEL